MRKTKSKNFLILNLIALFIFLSVLIVKAQEVPQIPADAREAVPEKDLLEVFCLTTKYKSGEFFAALDALNEVLVPALNDLKTIGMDVAIPDISGYLAQGQAKLDAVCSSQNYEAAQKAMKDLVDFGETVKQELGGLNSSLGQELKAKGDEMRTKVENQLNVLAEQEKIKIEQELKSEAEALASQMRADLEQEMTTKEFTSEAQANAYANSRASQIKNEIESQIDNLAEQKKKEIEEKINSKASEILGGDGQKLKEIGEKMENIEEKINETIENKKQNYEQYRIQAMEKRRNLILAVLDKNIEEAINQIKEKADLLKEAKLNDSSVKTADEYIIDLNQDREILVEKIQAAIEKGDEAAINSAIEEMENKWEGLRQNLEADLAKRQSAKQICSEVIPQISQAKPQLENGITQCENGLDEINLEKGECDISPDKTLCPTIETIYNQLLTTKEKAQDMIAQINAAEEICSKVTEETPLDDILGVMLSLKETGPEFQKEISSLKEKWEADKNKLEEALSKKPTIKEICLQSSPQLLSGKSQIENAINEIKGVQNGCQGNTEAKCKFVNSYSDKFDLAQEKGKALLDKINSAENKCKGKTTLAELVPLLNGIKKDSEEFISLVEELKLLENLKEEKIYINAEDETNKSFYPSNYSWSSNEEKRAGYTETGNWYLSMGGDSLSYNFTIREEGSYTLWIRDISTHTHSEGARAVNVIVDGKNYGSFAENATRGPEPGTWEWHKTATFKLQPGVHTLTIEKAKTTSAAAILDAYFITNNPLVTP